MGPFLRESELGGAARQVEFLAGINHQADILLFEYGQAQDYFLSPLRVVFHKEVYPLVSQSPNVDNFDRLMREWERQGKRVHLISSEEHTLLLSKSFEFFPLARTEFHVRMAEAPYERIPRRMEDLRLPLQVYHIRPKTQHGLPHAVRANIGFHFGLKTSGLYRTELTSSQETYCWTGAQALLGLPMIEASHDALLVLRLGQDLPELHDPGRASVVFNGVQVAEESVQGKLHVVKYRIPRSILNRSGENLVVLQTPTLSLAGIGLSDDRRELGIMLDSIMLLSLAPVSGNNSYRIDLASELGDVEADLSGFFLRGTDNYRWSGPVARLVLPAPLSAEKNLKVDIRAVKSCPDPRVRQFLTAFLDGKELGKRELVGTGEEFKVYSFAIPQSLPHSVNPTIELKTDPPWNPKEAGNSVDWRTLGCAVDWVQIGGEEAISADESR